MIGGKYRNVVLVTLILGGFVLFMIVTTAWVIHDVSKGRSCVRTCEQKGTKESLLKRMEPVEREATRANK